jgi:hypothetical protein
MASRHGQLVRACMDYLTLLHYETFPVPNRGVPRKNKRTGAMVWGRGLVKAGVADIVACSPHGRFVAVEVKISPDKLRPEQENFALAIQRRDGTFIEVRDTIDALIQAHKKGIL